MKTLVFEVRAEMFFIKNVFESTIKFVFYFSTAGKTRRLHRELSQKKNQPNFLNI